MTAHCGKILFPSVKAGILLRNALQIAKMVIIPPIIYIVMILNKFGKCTLIFIGFLQGKKIICSQFKVLIMKHEAAINI